jgi:hypothetical protein
MTSRKRAPHFAATAKVFRSSSLRSWDSTRKTFSPLGHKVTPFRQRACLPAVEPMPSGFKISDKTNFDSAVSI